MSTDQPQQTDGCDPMSEQEISTEEACAMYAEHWCADELSELAQGQEDIACEMRDILKAPSDEEATEPIRWWGIWPRDGFEDALSDVAAFRRKNLPQLGRSGGDAEPLSAEPYTREELAQAVVEHRGFYPLLWPYAGAPEPFDAARLLATLAARDAEIARQEAIAYRLGDECAELRAEIERLKNSRRIDKEVWRELENQCYQNLGHKREHGYDLRWRCTQAKAENVKLRAALRRYGMHEVACCADDSPAECICGFDAALRGEEG